MSTRKTTSKIDGSIVTQVSSPIYDIVYVKPIPGKRKSATNLEIRTSEGHILLGGREVNALRKVLAKA